MSSVETVNVRSTGDHAHTLALPAGKATEKCPWCGQAITRQEYKRIRERIEAEGRARVAEVEKTLAERFAREQARAEAKKKSEIEAARRAGIKAAETLINERLQGARESFEKRMREAIAAEKTKAYAERQKLDAQLQELQRRLQRRTAHELGEEGELDLYSELTRQFPTDQIERIKKGVEGGDIRVRVVQSGNVCGCILIEAKNTSRFMSKYVAKLRSDQLREKADHAILVTRVFPAGCEQLAVQSDIVIVAPQRLLVLMGLLRKQVISAYSARLSQEDRAEKASAIYRFVASDTFRQMLDQTCKLTDELTAIDRSEVAAHQRVWTRRAELVRAVQKANQDIATEIDAIIGTGAACAPRSLAEGEALPLAHLAAK